MADKGKRVEAIAYMRTSSATNVGDSKDSEARQRKASRASPSRRVWSSLTGSTTRL